MAELTATGRARDLLRRLAGLAARLHRPGADRPGPGQPDSDRPDADRPEAGRLGDDAAGGDSGAAGDAASRTGATAGEATAGDASAGDASAAGGAARPRWWRRVTARVVTALAVLLVLFALNAPNQISHLTPASFVRIPVEALAWVVLIPLLPAGVRRWVATLAGTLLGLLTIMKIADMGFIAILARPFDPVVDWPLLGSAVEFLSDSAGRGAAIGAAVAAAALAAVVLVLMALAVMRLTRQVAGHHPLAVRVAAVLGVVSLAGALAGVPVLPEDPVAVLAYDRALQVRDGLQDRGAFAAAASVDPFGKVGGGDLLTDLRGKDVVLAFVESYGRSAVEDPRFSAEVRSVLQAGERRLGAAGYTSRSGFLTSPTVGGSSWLAHATLLSGMWVDDQQRYNTLVTSDRLTLNRAFQRAGWRSVAVMPGVVKDWPEAEYFGYDQVYASDDLQYRGPRLNWAAVPDQFTMSAFQRSERAAADHAPVMAEIALISSHGPWWPIPPEVDWAAVGDGSVFETIAEEDKPDDDVLQDPDTMRTNYGRATAYSLETLISYVEEYGDEDLVLILLGDHQPAPIVTGEASRDVPITILAGDPAVLDRISGWDWQDGLLPDPQAPVWPMDAFRDRFLTAFGSTIAVDLGR